MLIIPVFECGKAVFESRADVTEQVNETVADWGGLCRSGVKHILCWPAINGRIKEHNSKWFDWVVITAKEKLWMGEIYSFICLFILLTGSGRNLLGRMWCHTVVPQLWQQLYTGSLLAASCVLGVDSSSLEKDPSNGLGPGGEKTKSQSQSVIVCCCCCCLTNCRPLLQVGKSVVSGASEVFQRSQGEGIQVEFHSGWYFLFWCCLKNV